MTFWEFWNEHAFLAWCALWLLWGVLLVGAVLVEFAFKVVNRLLRTIKVCVRGWPAAGLDADGDFRQSSNADTVPDRRLRCQGETHHEGDKMADGTVSPIRLRNCEVEELLSDWGGYVRTYRHLQGALHRNTSSLLDAQEQKATRAPGTHSNPTLSNLLAEERADLRVPAAVDAIIGSYASLTRLMLVLRFVGEPQKDFMRPRVVLVPMQWSAIETRMELTQRDRESAMRLIKRQLRHDLTETLPDPALWSWVDARRVG